MEINKLKEKMKKMTYSQLTKVWGFQRMEKRRICNKCEHIDSCVEELYLEGNMPDKFVCDNFKLNQRGEC